MSRRFLLASVALSLTLSTFAVKPARAQDSAPGTPLFSPLDTTGAAYTILVDGTLSQNNPSANQYTNLQDAYAAAPAGTATNPTVIGIKPNLYNLDTTTPGTPGLTISKNYITLLGLTNDQRNVVLYGDQGNEEGAGSPTQTYDGYVIDVTATGFTARNLTIGNFCNVNYQYPGAPGVPAQTIAERNSTITQAVAIETSGDQHVFDHVSLLSRLDTTFIFSTRAYFTNVYIEGTNDFIGGGTISVWQNCYVYYPTGGGEGTVTGTVFINTTFVYATIPGGGAMEFYKGPTSGGAYPEGGTLPAALINCTLPVNVLTANSSSVSWVYGYAPLRQNIYTLTYQNKDTNGNPAVIADSSQGAPTFTLSRELTATQAEAFNPWNLLSATPTGVQDGWDPAGVGPYYIGLGEGSLPFGMSMTNGSPTVITPGSVAGVQATISAGVYPARGPAASTITWSTTSPLVSLSPATGASVTVTGTNNTGVSQYVPINATLANGFYITAWVYVEPPYISPPTFTSPPTLSAPFNGTVTVNYQLNLASNRTDNSIINWYSCDDSSGTNPRAVAISASYTPPPINNVPLATYTLQLGDVGRYLEAIVTPQADISSPGTAMSVIATTPIAFSNIVSTTDAPNLTNFPVTAVSSYVNGYWTVNGTWTNEAQPVGSTFVNGWGLRASSQGAALLYEQEGPVGDMVVSVVMTPEKTAGQGFGSPGSGADSTPTSIVQNADIYIKYDPSTGNGYSVRWWRTTASSTETEWQLYQHTAGVGTPINATQVLTGVFFPTTYITLSIIGTNFTVNAYNSANTNTLSLQGTVTPNTYGGSGTRWSGTVPSGNSVAYSAFQISYPGTVQLSTSAALTQLGGGGYQAVVTVKNSGTAYAQNVALTTATLGAANGASLPASLGAIPPGGQAQTTITYPSSAGAPGAGAAEKYAGIYTGGSFSASIRATLP